MLGLLGIGLGVLLIMNISELKTSNKIKNDILELSSTYLSEENNHAKTELTCVIMKGFVNSLKMFKLDNGTYPSTENVFQLLIPQYLEKIPTDGWGNKLSYIKLGNSFDILSTGNGTKIQYDQCK